MMGIIEAKKNFHVCFIGFIISLELKELLRIVYVIFTKKH